MNPQPGSSVISSGHLDVILPYKALAILRLRARLYRLEKTRRGGTICAAMGKPPFMLDEGSTVVGLKSCSEPSLGFCN